MKLKLKKKELWLHDNLGTVVITRRNRYMYLPFWLEIYSDEYDEAKDKDSISVKTLRLGDLPEELENIIKDTRGELESVKVVMGVDYDKLLGTGNWTILKGDKFIASGSLSLPYRNFMNKIEIISELFHVDEMLKEDND
jgi:hypothetical protein